jgi:hypothetical protein
MATIINGSARSSRGFWASRNWPTELFDWAAAGAGRVPEFVVRRIGPEVGGVQTVVWKAGTVVGIPEPWSGESGPGSAFLTSRFGESDSRSAFLNSRSGELEPWSAPDFAVWRVTLVIGVPDFAVRRVETLVGGPQSAVQVMARDIRGSRSAVYRLPREVGFESIVNEPDRAIQPAIKTLSTDQPRKTSSRA